MDVHKRVELRHSLLDEIRGARGARASIQEALERVPGNGATNRGRKRALEAAYAATTEVINGLWLKVENLDDPEEGGDE